MILLDGSKMIVRVGTREVAFYHLAEVVKTLPPGEANEVLVAVEQHLKRLIRQNVEHDHDGD